MSVLVNAYATLRETPPLDFPHTLHGRRDRSDPELRQHLEGFIGYVLHQGSEEMTQAKYHVMRHLQRVQNHLSLTVAEADFNGFAQWAASANAICFLPDGTVRDPAGQVLIQPGRDEGLPDSDVPYPPSAEARRERTNSYLADAGIPVLETLPPVVAEEELDLRTAQEVAERALALIVVAVKAESLATGDPLPADRLRAMCPLGVAALSPHEQEFFDAQQPSQREIINHAWRYESLYVLQWALGLMDKLVFPTTVCDVPLVARTMFDNSHAAFVENARLRPAAEILDALDLHYRLHWALRQARHNQGRPVESVDPGVVQERHHALNWLVRFEDADWDEVDTPT